MSRDKRRQYGTGSVFQRASDGRWIGRLDAGWTPQGTRRRIQVSAKTEAACKAALKEKARQLAAGEVAASGTRARTTVKAWADQWLTEHRRRVRPTTYTTDAGAVRKWIIPTIGHRLLPDLTPADLRRVRDAILDAGRSTTTALHAATVLRAMLKAAIVEGHPVPQRVLAVAKPTRAANDRQALTVAQALAVLDEARTRPDAARWVAALLQGMRQGEALGLTWDAIDLDSRTLTVSWQLQDLPYRVARDPSSGFAVPEGHEARHLVGRLHLTRPKTGAGRRVIPLVPWMVDAFRVARETWEPNPWGLVWTERLTSGRVRPVRDSTDRAAWAELQAAAGVAHPTGRPFVLHEARHTTASLLLEAGVDRKVIEQILGQAVLVESYLHVNDAQTRAALDGMASRLGLGPSA